MSTNQNFKTNNEELEQTLVPSGSRRYDMIIYNGYTDKQTN